MQSRRMESQIVGKARKLSFRPILLCCGSEANTPTPLSAESASSRGIFFIFLGGGGGLIARFNFLLLPVDDICGDDSSSCSVCFKSLAHKKTNDRLDNDVQYYFRLDKSGISCLSRLRVSSINNTN